MFPVMATCVPDESRIPARRRWRAGTVRLTAIVVAVGVLGLVSFGGAAQAQTPRQVEATHVP